MRSSLSGLLSIALLVLGTAGVCDAQSAFRRGDSNADGQFNLSDGIFSLDFLFQGGSEPACLDAADADDSGELNITDAVVSFSFLFLGGAAPPEPLQECGLDTTNDNLSCEIFAACASDGDSDGDGLSDEFEREGWTVQIAGDGTGQVTESRHVTSDPLRRDTDGDGVDDAEEFELRIDPQRADSDGDLLTDDEEIRRWRTNPRDVDSDGDSRREGAGSETELWDRRELVVHSTSPTLADTDGDGVNDLDEIFDDQRNPLIAELPNVTISFVGDVDVRLDVEYSDSEGASTEYGVSLSQGESESTSSTESQSDRWAVAQSESIRTEAGASFGGGGFSISGSVARETTESSEFAEEHSTSFTSESARSSQQQYSDYRTDSSTRTETTSSGRISLGIRVHNTGDIAYSLSNLKLTVLAWEPASQGIGEGSFRTVSTLVPEVDEVTLQSGRSTETIQVHSESVNAAQIKEFLANPKTLHYDAAHFDLRNEDGRHFDFITEDVGFRTALIVIDFGDGRVEKYRVATNVARDADGALSGRVLGEVLNSLAIDYETSEDVNGKRVLQSLRDVAGEAGDPGSELPRGVWAVFTANETQSMSNFEDMRIEFGQTIRMVYLQDRDQDGLFGREENLWGSSDESVDTDLDEVDDYTEIRETFEVGPAITYEGSTIEAYSVRSDPRHADGDEDGLTDLEERARRTDPRAADTDLDQVNDGDEVEQGKLPLDGRDNEPPPDPSAFPTDALVHLKFDEGPDEHGNDMQRFEDCGSRGIDATRPNQAGGSLNPLAADRFGVFGKAMDFEDSMVNSDGRAGMVSLGEFGVGDSFTLAVWIKRDDHLSDHATLISQHEFIRLTTDSTCCGSKARVSFGPWNNTVAEIVEEERQSRESFSQWQLYVVVVYPDGGDTQVVLFRNGERTASGTIAGSKMLPLNRNGEWTLGSRWQTTISGRKTDPWFAIDGVLDDVRIFNRDLSIGEIQALYAEGDWGSE